MEIHPTRFMQALELFLGPSELENPWLRAKLSCLTFSGCFQIIKASFLLYYYNLNFLKWSPTLAMFTLLPSSHSSIYSRPSFCSYCSCQSYPWPPFWCFLWRSLGSTKKEVFTFLFYANSYLFRKLSQLSSYYLIIIFVIFVVAVLLSIQPLALPIGISVSLWRMEFWWEVVVASH